MSSKNLNAAKAAKKDEFYTQLPDIEEELQHYEKHFKGQTIYCNCDDPRASNFFHYFSHNFKRLGLKKLITSCYKNQSRDLFSKHDSDKAIWLEYNGEYAKDKNGNRVPDCDEIGINNFEGDGDFRSSETIELLKQSDIVVTNPPFSLFRQYVSQLMEYGKKFLIIGSMNTVTTKEFWPFIREGKIWLGVNGPNKDRWYVVPNGYPMRKGRSYVDDEGVQWSSLGNVCWYTNLDHPRRHEKITLHREFDSEAYTEYDNYDAIEVKYIKDIPLGYKGVMGVPISFLDKHNPNQFQIVGLDRDIMWGHIPELAKKAGGGVVK